MKSDLIFDIGMNNGDDTAYYLHRGFNVVAVEADPDLTADCQERFSEAIAAGRLTIINAAIAEHMGEADFWISEQYRYLNSFDKSVASRFNLPCHSIKVKTIPLRALLAEHGVPFYMKVDIEGHDHIAVADISLQDAPEFISMELNSVDDFWLLRSKGYRRFKCIQQGVFRPVLSPILSIRSLLDVAMIRFKTTALVNRLRARYRSLRPLPHSVPGLGEWDFTVGSSGPFGEATPGEWMSFENVLHAWLSQQIGHEFGYRASPAAMNVWFDLHARLS